MFRMVYIRFVHGIGGIVVVGSVASLASIATEQRFRGDGLEKMNDINTLYRCVENERK